MKRIHFHSGSQASYCLLHTSRYLLSKRLYAGSHKSPETPVCCAVLLVCWQNTRKKWSNSSVITTAGYCEFNWKLKDDPLKTEAANLWLTWDWKEGDLDPHKKRCHFQTESSPHLHHNSQLQSSLRISQSLQIYTHRAGHSGSTQAEKWNWDRDIKLILTLFPSHSSLILALNCVNDVSIPISFNEGKQSVTCWKIRDLKAEV